MFTGPARSLLSHPDSKQVFPLVQKDLAVFQIVLIHWEKKTRNNVFIFFSQSPQVFMNIDDIPPEPLYFYRLNSHSSLSISL